MTLFATHLRCCSSQANSSQIKIFKRIFVAKDFLSHTITLMDCDLNFFEKKKKILSIYQKTKRIHWSDTSQRCRHSLWLSNSFRNDPFERNGLLCTKPLCLLQPLFCEHNQEHPVQIWINTQRIVEKHTV